jgi:hypothetical protein
MTCGLSLSDWVGIANLLAAVGAIVVAVRALVVARGTLQEAEENWRQQKWFDLYAKADEAHSLLVRYKKIYPTVLQNPTTEGKQDWNALMSVFLEAYTMAGCFPVNPAVNSLLAATGAFTGLADAYDETRFTKLGDAVEELRQRALLKPSVLG